MANLYSVPLKNSVQKTLAGTLTQAETGTITLDSSVALELQASSTMKGILVVDRVDVNGNLTPLKAEYIAFTGVSGSTVTGLTRGLAGTSAQGHAIGAIVEFVPDITWAQAINDVFTTQHNDDGTHKTLSSISLASVTLNNSYLSNATIIGGGIASLTLSNVVISGSGGTLASTTILTSNIDTFSFKNINGPEGYLINGKIVPSVASNNLTVAIKTLAGNDASASDPIYVRIGDNVRTITGALSVTKNAGTNWCNSGATETAGKEIDYFVYLFWNASASRVMIGFSRIPYGRTYGDFFFAAENNEKSIPMFDTTSSATTDEGALIGRFAATLSAGAGYTWSVPTFTANNLIQRPIFETRYLDFVPVFTGFTGSNTVYLAKYKLDLRNFIFSLYNLGTSNSATYDFTVPFNVINNSGGYMGIVLPIADNNVWSAGVMGLPDNSKTIKVGKAVSSISANAYGGFTASGNKAIQVNYIATEI